jgi:hypothetical protein
VRQQCGIFNVILDTAKRLHQHLNFKECSVDLAFILHLALSPEGWHMAGHPKLHDSAIHGYNLVEQ